MAEIRLRDLKDRHAGEDIVVCGCGRSLLDFREPESYTTIGVNDVGRKFVPDYLLVVNPRESFSRERWESIVKTHPPVLLSQYKLDIPCRDTVRVRLGRYARPDFDDPNVLHYSQNSPYMALHLAVRMGARRIGLCGVDFTDHHFFGPTGRHSLAPKLAAIDREYASLNRALRAHGIEVINLSPESRLTAFRKGSLDEIRKSPRKIAGAGASPGVLSARVFFVNYRFLACGDLFRTGLRNAAGDLGVPCDEAYWDDPDLPGKVRRFGPDLMVVIHGRNFARRWGREFAPWRSAVWLLDEPYEVDDTRAYSGRFDAVFVNDPSTLSLHRAASYLPVGYDPHVHYDRPGPRRHGVGFVGGHNPRRQAVLERLAHAGRLSYLVGGPWNGTTLRALTLSANVAPERTADLYRETRVVLNVFRSRHHFNRERVPATSLNPRIYEALACGALPLSETRPEAVERFPELPLFTDERDLVDTVNRLLDHPDEIEQRLRACRERLPGNSYSDRLRTVLETCLGTARSTPPAAEPSHRTSEVEATSYDWVPDPDVASRHEDGSWILKRAAPDPGPGSERGLVGRRLYREASLSFEVFLQQGTCFLAKILQEEPENQRSNSYHFLAAAGRAYVARHNHVFHDVPFRQGAWERLELLYQGEILSCFRGGSLVFRTSCGLLRQGYSFLGVKGGEARLRNVILRGTPITPTAHPAAEPVPAPRAQDPPRVSVITTVYDRVECLRRCIRSVKRLLFRDFEHVIVSDGPPHAAARAIEAVIRAEDEGRLRHLPLEKRHNDWGITPASAGLKAARGGFISFLSDDNGYAPDHFGCLVQSLEDDPGLGFAYSSCRYDGRLRLESPVPGPGRIDLGQPLFRKDLFDAHLGGTIPFREFAWDWRMIHAFLLKGVRWKHVNRPTFFFRLQKYPEMIA